MPPEYRAQPAARVRNGIAWIGFGTGVLTLLSIALQLVLPVTGPYLIILGLIAIAASIIAIVRFGRRSVTVLWAPIVGLALAVLAEMVILALIAILADHASVASPSSPSNTSNVIGSPATSSINYSMGQGALQYLPTGNQPLTTVAMKELALVTALKAIYKPGEYPSSLSLNSAGDIVASDGHNFGSYLEYHWIIDYRLSANGTFILELTGADRSEVAVYFSRSDQYWAWCGDSDTTCTTASPLPPSTSLRPDLSTTGNSAGTT